MEKYNSKQYEEQIILVAKGWGLSEEEMNNKYGRLDKIRRILNKMVRVPKNNDGNLYYWIYTITKKYVSDYMFNNIFKNSIFRIINTETSSVNMYDLMILMLDELDNVRVSYDLRLEPIDEILSL